MLEKKWITNKSKKPAYKYILYDTAISLSHAAKAQRLTRDDYDDYSCYSLDGGNHILILEGDANRQRSKDFCFGFNKHHKVEIFWVQHEDKRKVVVIDKMQIPKAGQ